MTPRAAGLGTALVLVALNLRLGIASVPPIVDDVRGALGLSNAAVGAVTTLPVLCFGFAAFGAPALARRWGDERVILGCLMLLVAGISLRLVPAVALFFGGTLVLGVGVAVINVLLPSVVKRAYPRPETITALYVTAIMAGGGLVLAVTVPLTHVFGGWDRALAIWALPAAIAAVAWLPVVRARVPSGDATAEPVRLWDDRQAWALAGMFACQTLLGFALLAWVPKILRDSGLGQGQAGALAAIVMMLGIPTAVAVPVLAARTGGSRTLIVATSVPWWIGLAGLLALPADGTAVWMVLLGLGQGAGFALPLALIVLRSPDSQHAAALSSMVQGIGYVVGGACGPPLIGLLHDVTGGWTASLMLLMAIAGVQLGFGLMTARSPARAHRIHV